MSRIRSVVRPNRPRPMSFLSRLLLRSPIFVSGLFLLSSFASLLTTLLENGKDAKIDGEQAQIIFYRFFQWLSFLYATESLVEGLQHAGYPLLHANIREQWWELMLTATLLHFNGSASFPIVTGLSVNLDLLHEQRLVLVQVLSLNVLRLLSLCLFGMLLSNGPRFRLPICIVWGLADGFHYLWCLQNYQRSSYPFILHVHRLPELLALGLALLTHLLYFAVVVFNGNPVVAPAAVVAQWPEWHDDFSTSVLKWANASLLIHRAMTGFRLPLSPVQAPVPSEPSWYNLRSRASRTGQGLKRFLDFGQKEMSGLEQSESASISSLLQLAWISPSKVNPNEKSLNRVKDRPVPFSDEIIEDETDDEDWIPHQSDADSFSSSEGDALSEMDPRARLEVLEDVMYLNGITEGEAPCRSLEFTPSPIVPNRSITTPSLCCVCWAEQRNVILYPCRCLSLCDGCRESLADKGFDKCPTCRSQVEGYMLIYIP